MVSTNELISLLLVEDDENDRRIITDVLRRCDRALLPQVGIAVVESLAEAVSVEVMPDLVLLDLNLPDSWGLETFEKVHAHLTDVPIVVLSNLDAHDLMSAGAEDVLGKDVLVADVLCRVVHHAVSRSRLRRRLAELSDEQEVLRIEASLQPPTTGPSAQPVGTPELGDAQPIIAGQIQNLLADVIELRLEERVFAEERGAAIQLRAIADHLGLLQAGPRDVVRIYSDVMAEATATLPYSRRRAFVSEGRLVLVELLGLLVAHYRRHAVGLRRAPSAHTW